MAKHIDSSSKIKMSDLLSEGGFTFDIEKQDFGTDDDYIIYTTPYFTNDEMLHILNMNHNDNDEEHEKNDEEHEENDKEHEENDEAFNGLNFEGLRKIMTPIDTSQKVMKYVKKKGVGECIPINAQVICHYVAYYEDSDIPFDSTYGGRPRKLQTNEIIPGLSMGLATMRKDEKAAFLIHPDLAYLELGCIPIVPPNSVVLFDIHLIDFLDNGSENTENLTVEEKESFEYIITIVEQKLATARHFALRDTNMKRAIREYAAAVHTLENMKLQNDTEEEKMFELLTKARTNLAICYNKEDMPRKACIACSLLPEDKRTAKTYYTFGKALFLLGEFKDAMYRLQKALKMEPMNDEIKILINKTNIRKLKYLEVEKQLWKRNFQFKTDKPKNVSEFQKALRELCTSIVNKDILRQGFPMEDLTDEEYTVLCDEAINQGLRVYRAEKYGRKIVYIQKGNP